MNELNYYTVDGAVGWNQDWFRDWWMHLGGCAAVTACDVCIHLAREHGRTALYPYDARHVLRAEYEDFAMQMKPYLKPRRTGIDRLSIYLAGLHSYWQDCGVFSLAAEGLSGEAPWTAAWDLICRQVDANMLVPCLLLHHENKIFNDWQWHWFNLAGYDFRQGRPMVRAVTYGQSFWLDFRALWDTGKARKGGLIKISQR